MERFEDRRPVAGGKRRLGTGDPDDVDVLALSLELDLAVSLPRTNLCVARLSASVQEFPAASFRRCDSKETLLDVVRALFVALAVLVAIYVARWWTALARAHCLPVGATHEACALTRSSC